LGGVAYQTLADRAALKRAVAAVRAQHPQLPLRDSGGFILAIPGSTDVWWMGVDALTDGLSSQSLTQAEQVSRYAIHQLVQQLKHEPGCEHVYLQATGPQIGIRESRHPMARHMLCESDALTGARSTSAVARASWYVERHDTPGKPTAKDLGGEGFFDIPLDALRATHIDNLWLAGRTIGADRSAYASLRVMGTAFATGHAAGVAAALALAGKTDAASVRSTLMAQQAIL
jgi:hypothetical protein